MSNDVNAEAELLPTLQAARQAVQAFLDMVNIIQKWQALPIPAILETAQHNCPIILEQLDAAIATQNTSLVESRDE